MNTNFIHFSKFIVSFLYFRFGITLANPMRWDPDTIFWCWYLLMTHCGIICLRWRWFSSTVTFNVSIDLSNIHNNPINAHYLTMQWHRRNHLFSGALSSIFFSEKNGLWHGIGGEFMVLLKFSRWYYGDIHKPRGQSNGESD